MLPRLTQGTVRTSSNALLLNSCRLSVPSNACRTYALLRDPARGRSRVTRNPNPKSTLSPLPVVPQKLEPASREVVQEAPLLLEGNPDSGGLEKLLANDVLVVTRQIEMMNIFMGFEVANRYAINDVNGNVMGYIAEEPKGFMGTVARQMFRTHRSFRSVIMDVNGTPILWIRRPFSWINSRILVQRKLAESDDSSGDEHTSLVNLGEAKQEWHPWRRKYHLFLGKPEGHFHQFAKVNAPMLSWNFFLQNEGDLNIASIRKGWTGLGREMFTDTSQYTIRLAPDPEAPTTASTTAQSIVPKVMSMEERALVLALSVGIDFDYFSRHSEGSGFGLPFLALFSVFE